MIVFVDDQVVFADDEVSECVLGAAVVELEVDETIDDVVVFGMATSGVYTR